MNESNELGQVTEETVMDEMCNFCSATGEDSNNAQIMGIGSCDECAEQYAEDPVPFEAKILRVL